jgi:hypothetical protein
MPGRIALAAHALAVTWLLGASSGAASEAVYEIRRLSESDVVGIYRDVLRDGFRYGERDWREAAFGARAGYWGDGVSAGNQGIRTVGDMVLTGATLLRHDPSIDERTRRETLDKVAAALRFITATHRTGDQKCTDGKPWGATARFGPESWQSGMWTGTIARGAWLVWDQLDAPLREDLQRVVAWESDVLADRKPPHNVALDTKAEENGWQVPCLVAAELMFPDHPHAARWRDASVRYMMNTLCTDADTRDATVVDGRPVRDWVGGANLHPDFTLENHNAFHPSYVACSSYFLTQAQLCYAYAGRPAPQAATHHLDDTWRMFRRVILPWGEAAYPQGMDWELHGLPYINLYAALATCEHDPFASRMEQSILQYTRAWQRRGDGSLAFPGSKLGVTRHAINCEQLAYGLLAHQVFGPSVEPLTSAAAAVQEQGVRDYPHVGFTAHRTDRKFVSFSWKNRVTGLLIPIGDGHAGNPFFSAPIAAGLIGSFDLTPRGDVKTQVVEHASNPTEHGFESTGTVLLNGGRLRQTLRVVSVGRQAAVYEDRVTAVSDVTVRSERGVPVGIENDEISGGVRRVTDANGARTFEWKSPATQPSALAGTWANVDDRLGMIALSGSGVTYVQASGYSPGISVCADVLYGSYSDRARSFKAGDEVARRLVVLFVEVTAEETAALAAACKVDEGAAGRTLHLKRPEGGDADVALGFAR